MAPPGSGPMGTVDSRQGKMCWRRRWGRTTCRHRSRFGWKWFQVPADRMQTCGLGLNCAGVRQADDREPYYRVCWQFVLRYPANTDTCFNNSSTTYTKNSGDPTPPTVVETLQHLQTMQQVCYKWASKHVKHPDSK